MAEALIHLKSPMNYRMQRKLLAIGLCGFFGLASSSSAVFLWKGSANAQIVPDNTLPTPSTVRAEGNALVIEGGGSAGGNLFHSFSEFSVLTGNEAFFNNAADIQNIISRVTGNNISNIDGLLRANGTANLFFINPNGIAFGPEAALDIGGSFVASSAESLVFADGTVFSTPGNDSNAPLLTVSAPVGLQLGANPGAIRVADGGHDVFFDFSISGFNESTDPGLQVLPDRTLALVGGAVDLEGGILNAPSGRVELGGAADTTVALTPVSDGFALNYEENANFQPIQFLGAAFAGASGEGGSIQVRGQSLRLADGSLLLVQHDGTASGGSIDIDVTDTIEITGFSLNPDGSTGERTAVVLAIVGEGDGEGIDISARSVLITNEGGVIVFTGGDGASGDVNVVATDEVRLTSIPNAINDTAIAVNSFGAGAGGDLRITAQQVALEGNSSSVQTSVQVFAGFSGGPSGDIIVNAQRAIVKDGGVFETFASSSEPGGNIIVNVQQVIAEGGGQFVATTFSSGPGGTVTIDASESVEFTGFDPNTLLRSGVFANTNGIGDAGSVEVNTQRIVVRDGATINSSTAAGGNAGSVMVNASESIEISDSPAPDLRSSISSSAIIIDEDIRAALGLPDVPTGNAGSVTVITEELTVDNANLTVFAEGPGDAGTLAVEVTRLNTDNTGLIGASTVSGEGGNITLNIGDSLSLRRTSQISAAAGGEGNGGNVTIDTSTLALIESSIISANAFEGIGGNIEISTQGLFFPTDTLVTDIITASSDLGVDGVVEITEPEVDTDAALVELSEEFADPTERVETGCAADEGSSFTYAGRGGLPEDPTNPLFDSPLWQDWQDYSQNNSAAVSERPVPATEDALARPSLREVVSPSIEANTWRVAPDGTVTLLAEAASVPELELAPSCQSNFAQR